MRDSAERCVARPSLSVWKDRQAEVGHALDVRCRAPRIFPVKALPMENDRMAVAERCSGPVGQCAEHKKIINRLIRMSQEIWDRSNSVPRIESVPFN